MSHSLGEKEREAPSANHKASCCWCCPRCITMEMAAISVPIDNSYGRCIHFSQWRGIDLHLHSRITSQNSIYINYGLISDIHALTSMPSPPHLTPFSMWTLYSFSQQIMERVQDQPFWTDPHLLFHSLFNMGLFFSLHSSSPFLTLSSFGLCSCISVVDLRDGGT